MRYNLLILMLLLVMSGCKTKKVIAPITERSKDEVLKSLLERNIDFRWYEAKMSAYIDSPDEKISGSIHTKMVKDSSMLISLKKFGIEAARVYADKYNYTVLYRFDAAYESGHINDIKKIMSFSVGLEDLQQLLSGNIILPDTAQTTITKVDNQYQVTSSVDGLWMQYFVNIHNLELTKMTITDQSNRKATITFQDYKNVPGVGNVAFTRNFSVPYNSHGDANLELKISSIEINKPFVIKFSIPNNYERL